MPRLLSPEQIERFQSDGYFAGKFRCLSSEQAAQILNWYEDYEAETKQDVQFQLKLKPHLVLTRLYDLCRNPTILDAVEDVIGPDILCFASTFFAKKARDGTFVTWHQDGEYLGMEPRGWCVGISVAISASNEKNGGLKAIPRSHLKDYKAVRTSDSKNLLTHKSAIPDVDESEVVRFDLEPGEFSMHNANIVHSSEQNRSDGRRLTFTIIFLPTRCRPSLGRKPALLVRGTDRYGYWDADPVPTRDFDPVTLAHMNRCLAEFRNARLDRKEDRLQDSAGA